MRINDTTIMNNILSCTEKELMPLLNSLSGKGLMLGKQEEQKENVITHYADGCTTKVDWDNESGLPVLEVRVSYKTKNKIYVPKWARQVDIVYSGNEEIYVDIEVDKEHISDLTIISLHSTHEGTLNVNIKFDGAIRLQQYTTFGYVFASLYAGDKGLNTVSVYDDYTVDNIVPIMSAKGKYMYDDTDIGCKIVLNENNDLSKYLCSKYHLSTDWILYIKSYEAMVYYYTDSSLEEKVVLGKDTVRQMYEDKTLADLLDAPCITIEELKYG